MNVIVVFADGSVATPRLSGTILPGIVRDSVLTLLRDESRAVSERDIALAEVQDGIATGTVAEVFACGTAAAIVPIGRLVSPDFEATVGDGEPGPVTPAVRERIVDIQYGRAEDVHGWMRAVS